MGEVVGLRENSVFAHGEVDADLVTRLKALLADAESGSLRAIAYAAVDSDRSVITSWNGHCDRHDMTAAISTLNYRFIRDNTSLD